MLPAFWKLHLDFQLRKRHEIVGKHGEGGPHLLRIEARSPSARNGFRAPRCLAHRFFHQGVHAFHSVSGIF